jgi:peptidyl-prolyl cis-trans isomerase D
MLAAIKKMMKSWFVAGILGLLVLCMAFLGMAQFDPFKAQIGSWVVKAGSREISGPEFRAMFDQQKGRLEQQYQQQISNDMAVQNGFDRQVLDDMAQGEALMALLGRLGLRAPDSLVDEAMKEELLKAGMFDELTGKLNQGAYAEALQRMNLTDDMYRRSVADNIIRQQFVTSLTGGFQAPRIYSALQGAYLLQERDVNYFLITPASLGPVATPTEAELVAFMNENKDRLMRPEFRTLSVVRFNGEAYKEGMKADPAEVEKRFNFRKDSLSSPETRTVVQITVKSEKAGAEVSDRLKKGEDPAVVARSVGVEPVVYADKPRSALFDKAIGDAAFSLPEGGVSGPLKGELGMAVVKVESITAGKAANLEEHRAEIERDVIAAAANNKAYAEAQAYDDAHRQGASFAESVAKSGGKLITIGPVSAEGLAPDGKPVAGITKELIETAFATEAGQESQLVEVSAGDQFALRVEKVIPPALPPLSEVRDDLTKVIIGQKQAKMMQDRAEALSARLRKGEDIKAVAASGGYKLVSLGKLTRASAGDHKDLGDQVLQAALDGSKGQVFNAVVPRQGMLVGKITAVRSGSTAQIAQMTEQVRPTFSQSIYQDVVGSIQAHAKDKVTVKTDRARALTALGLDPKDYEDKAEEAKGDKKDAKSK